MINIMPPAVPSTWSPSTW